MASADAFPAADIDKELNPSKNKNFEVDPLSSDVARETEKQNEEARRIEEQEKQRNAQLQNLKTAIIVSGIVVAVAGAVFAITKKLREN